MIGCLPTQALAFLAVFVSATHATQAIAFEWKPGLTQRMGKEPQLVLRHYDQGSKIEIEAVIT